MINTDEYTTFGDSALEERNPMVEEIITIAEGIALDIEKLPKSSDYKDLITKIASSNRFSQFKSISTIALATACLGLSILIAFTINALIQL